MNNSSLHQHLLRKFGKQIFQIGTCSTSNLSSRSIPNILNRTTGYCQKNYSIYNPSNNERIMAYEKKLSDGLRKQKNQNKSAQAGLHFELMINKTNIENHFIADLSKYSHAKNVHPVDKSIIAEDKEFRREFKPFVKISTSRKHIQEMEKQLKKEQINKTNIENQFISDLSKYSRAKNVHSTHKSIIEEDAEDKEFSYIEPTPIEDEEEALYILKYYQDLEPKEEEENTEAKDLLDSILEERKRTEHGWA